MKNDHLKISFLSTLKRGVKGCESIYIVQTKIYYRNLEIATKIQKCNKVKCFKDSLKLNVRFLVISISLKEFPPVKQTQHNIFN